MNTNTKLGTGDQQLMRVASYRPHLKIDTLQAFDELGICCLTTPSDIGSYCWDDHTRVRQQYYRECEELLLSFFPGSTSAYVFDHEARDSKKALSQSN